MSLSAIRAIKTKKLEDDMINQAPVKAWKNWGMQKLLVSLTQEFVFYSGKLQGFHIYYLKTVSLSMILKMITLLQGVPYCTTFE